MPEEIMEPYQTDHEFREACRFLMQTSTSIKERREIIQRLEITPKKTLPFLPLITSNLHGKPIELQIDIINFVAFFSDIGEDISSCCAELSSHLSSQSADIRKLCKKLIIHMGENGKAAEDFALGCLRNHDPEIIHTGLDILLSINTNISKSIKSRIKAVITANPNEAQIISKCNTIIGIVDKLCNTTPNEQHVSAAALDITGLQTDKTALKNLSALIIEDNAAFRYSIADALRHFSMNVDEADCGKSAQAMMMQSINQLAAYDLILLDLRLPDINGVKLLRMIREHPVLASTPVITITGINNPDIAKTVQALGVHAFLTKPVGLAEILKLTFDLFKAKK